MAHDTFDSSQDAIIILDDGIDAALPQQAKPWRVLVVDDEVDVHRTTAFALSGITILDHEIELIHAHSAAEGWERMHEFDDVAVALIDVVMETPDAGLRLVRDLRAAGFSDTRIVLRTGQPGYAPELKVITEWEIDDYRTKDEMTRTRLVTVLTGCIRAYEKIRTISRSRAGLEMIVESSTELFHRTNLELFSSGVLTQIAALLGVAPNGLVCLEMGRGNHEESRIISAGGRFFESRGKSLHAIDDPEILALADRASRASGPLREHGYLAMRFECSAGRALLTIIEDPAETSKSDLDLLSLFSTNIAVGFQNVRLVEELDRLAYVDPIIEVPNLNAFEAALRAHLESKGPTGRMALVHVDAFRSIVAVNGHTIARRFMRAVYDSLVEAGGSALTVARIGDAIFALLGKKVILTPDFLKKIFERNHRLDDIELMSTATGSIFDLADIGDDPDTMLSDADSALMYVRQNHFGHMEVFDSTMRAHIQRRIAIQSALKEVVSAFDGFAVYLQAKVSLTTGKIVGAEALLRWSLDGKPISPAEFIPIAESTGLTYSLTEFVIDTVGRWQSARGDAHPLPIAINLSMVDLNTPGFAGRLLAHVKKAGLTPDTVEFEVTEGVAMQDKPWASEQVRELNQAGFRIALDDFGTGYSSLGTISKLHIDTLKIDRSFVGDLDVRSARQSLAAIIIAMTNALNVDNVAEGIETKEQQQALTFLGCDAGQGFLFGRPIDIDSFDPNAVIDVSL